MCDIWGQGLPFAAQGDTVRGEYDPGMKEVMGHVGETVDAVTELAKELRDVTHALNRDGQLEKTVQDFAATSHELRAVVSERMQPGVVYTTFHFPESGANVITTDNSDWATNCPEYKVTAVQVMPVMQPSAWQQEYSRFNRVQQELLDARVETTT